MKKSKYNLIIDHGEKKLAFNAMSCALAEVDESFFKIIDNIDNINLENLSDELKDTYFQMKEGGYIVDDEIDEMNLIKYRNFSSKFNNDGLGLTIAPLLSCNFACPYCYENPKSGIMSDEVVDAIIKMIEKKAKKSEPISITWYGGEPLLAKDLIFSMSERIIEICDKNNSRYSAYMVSNGYLINEDIIEKLKKSRITGIQITIDGPPDIHNNRRKLRNSSEPTFDKILNNVLLLIDNDIDVTIRINVDKTNVDRLEELMDIFIEKGLQKCFISLGHVETYTDSCKDISDTCLNIEEYAIESLENQKLLFSKGFNVKEYPNYPGIKGNYCCADIVSSFVVDQDGYLYKCWNDVGTVERAVGNVKDIEGENNNPKMISLNTDYLLWNPFDYKECRECNLLPICMGGCPYMGLKNKKSPKCEKWKYNIEEVLKVTYEQRKEDNI